MRPFGLVSVCFSLCWFCSLFNFRIPHSPQFSLLWYAGVRRNFEECLLFLSPCLGHDSLINCNACLFIKFVLDQGVSIIKINKQHSAHSFSKPLLSSLFLLNYFIYM